MYYDCAYSIMSVINMMDQQKRTLTEGSHSESKS